MRRWHFAFAALLVVPGLLGYTGGSSGVAVTGWNGLFAPGEAHAQVVWGYPRDIRSDEWAVDTPAIAAQQLASPAFPSTNLRLGLGQLGRTVVATPVLDWGIVFRPPMWPLLIPGTWGHGVRWYMRVALLFAGLLAWLGAMCSGSELDRDALRRREIIAAFATCAVFMSGTMQWWLSHTMIDVVAFGGLSVGCAQQYIRAVGRRARARWWLATWYCASCAFFSFYPPIWGPMLWVLCAAALDLAWRSTADVRRTVTASLPIIITFAAAILTSVCYYAPYLSAVADTSYPGRRVATAGEIPVVRLLDLAWPSVNGVAPESGPELCLVRGSNVCEASAVEVLGLFVVIALALTSPRVRGAVFRTIRNTPLSVAACSILLLWVFVPVPSFIGAVTLLRWSPGARTWFVFGLSLATLMATLLAEWSAGGEPTGSRWQAVFVGAAVIFVSAVPVWKHAETVGAASLWTYLTPQLLTVGLSLATLLAIPSRWAPVLMAVTWAVPLTVAHAATNPVMRSSDLFRRGAGHAVVEAALHDAPGRLLDYATHEGDTLAAFGWPVLSSVQAAPDVHLFKYLSAEVPGLTDDVYNRYSRTRFALPPGSARAVHLDAIWVPVSPCSPRLASLGVNHFLLSPGSRLKSDCIPELQVRRAGRLLLLTRKVAVGWFGYSRDPLPATALDFDYRIGKGGERARAEFGREHLTLHVPAGPGSYSFAINRSLIARTTCVDASARQVDAHVIVATTGAAEGSCRFDYLDSPTALRRLLPSWPPTTSHVANFARTH